jgi:hypothetical protein
MIWLSKPWGFRSAWYGEASAVATWTTANAADYARKEAEHSAARQAASASEAQLLADPQSAYANGLEGATKSPFGSEATSIPAGMTSLVFVLNHISPVFWPTWLYSYWTVRPNRSIVWTMLPNSSRPNERFLARSFGTLPFSSSSPSTSYATSPQVS